MYFYACIYIGYFSRWNKHNLCAIVWAMTELVKNPRVMKKVQTEIRSCVGRKSNVDESELEKLGYLKMVVKETLRLHPPTVWERSKQLEESK